LSHGLEFKEQGFFYQGSIGAAYNKESLQKQGITHILTVAEKIDPAFPAALTYKVIPMYDDPAENVHGSFEEANQFIDEAFLDPKSKVLVHCFAGKSRASTFTLAYLMHRLHLDLKTCFEHLKQCRPIAEPNSGFIAQL